MGDIKQHDSRYAKKKRGTPGPNSMHAIAELGEDGIWMVDGKPYQKPRRLRYEGKGGATGKDDLYKDLDTGEPVRFYN